MSPYKLAIIDRLILTRIWTENFGVENFDFIKNAYVLVFLALNSFWLDEQKFGKNAKNAFFAKFLVLRPGKVRAKYGDESEMHGHMNQVCSSELEHLASV